jgi:hypothetical protein
MLVEFWAKMRTEFLLQKCTFLVQKRIRNFEQTCICLWYRNTKCLIQKCTEIWYISLKRDKYLTFIGVISYNNSCFIHRFHCLNCVTCLVYFYAVEKQNDNAFLFYGFDTRAWWLFYQKKTPKTWSTIGFLSAYSFTNWMSRPEFICIHGRIIL